MPKVISSGELAVMDVSGWKTAASLPQPSGSGVVRPLDRRRTGGLALRRQCGDRIPDLQRIDRRGDIVYAQQHRAILRGDQVRGLDFLFEALKVAPDAESAVGAVSRPLGIHPSDLVAVAAPKIKMQGAKSEKPYWVIAPHQLEAATRVCSALLYQNFPGADRVVNPFKMTKRK